MPLQHLSLIAFLAFAGFCCAQTSPTSAPGTNDTGIEGVVTVSPSHPGPARPGIASSAPLANTTFVASNQSGPITEFTTDDQGHFKVSLPAGRYSVTRKGQKTGIGRCGPFDVDVVTGQVAKVEWQCDSGMR